MQVKSEKRTQLFHGVLYVILVMIGLTMVIPFVWMLSTSLKPHAIMTVYEEWYQNWIPGEDVVRIRLDGDDVRAQKLGRDGERVNVRVTATGPRDGRTVRCAPSGVKEEDVYLRHYGREGWELAEPGTDAVKVRLFRTRSELGAPVQLPLHMLSTGASLAAFLEAEDGWISVQEQRRDSFAIQWRIIDRHPRFGEEFTLPESQVHDGWRARFCFSNYAKAWNAVNLGRGYLNSLFIAMLITIGQVFTSSLAAYAFARLEFRGRDALFFGYLATMMVPGAVTMIPVYILFAKGPAVLDAVFQSSVFTSDLFLFKWLEIGRPVGIDSYMALILPGLFSAYGTFMLRQFFMGIPRDLEDAAHIDGCSTFGIYWNIVLPLSKPALATLAIFTFIGNWKSFMWPLIVSQSRALRTLPVMLSYFQGEYNTEYHLLMAGSMMALLPVILVFILGQRFFVSGIRLGALKG